MARTIFRLWQFFLVDRCSPVCHSLRMSKPRSEDKAIGARLKSLRESKGVKQNFVANKLGITNNYLSELESGKKRWFAAMMLRYEKIIGVEN